MSYLWAQEVFSCSVSTLPSCCSYPPPHPASFSSFATCLHRDRFLRLLHPNTLGSFFFSLASLRCNHLLFFFQVLFIYLLFLHKHASLFFFSFYFLSFSLLVLYSFPSSYFPCFSFSSSSSYFFVFFLPPFFCSTYSFSLCFIFFNRHHSSLLSRFRYRPLCFLLSPTLSLSPPRPPLPPFLLPLTLPLIFRPLIVQSLPYLRGPALSMSSPPLRLYHYYIDAWLTHSFSP